MRALRFGSLFIPVDAMPEFTILLLLVGLAVFLFGSRKLALSLFGMAAWACLPQTYKSFLFDAAVELLSAVPWWMLALFLIWLIFRVAGRFVRDVAVHVTSDLMSAAIRWVFTSRIGWSSLITLILGGMFWTRIG